MNVQFDFGETRHIRVEVFSVYDDVFIIQNARYELIRKSDGKIESSGRVDVIGHVLDVTVTPKFIGRYDLKILYRISDETLIDTVELMVKG